MTCRAYQCSDTTYCPCGLTWDTNDPAPPECPEAARELEEARPEPVKRSKKPMELPIPSPIPIPPDHYLELRGIGHGLIGSQDFKVIMDGLKNAYQLGRRI